MSNPLIPILQARVAAAGGWLRFDDFMRVALYEPGLGYYSGPARKFGRRAGDGSDFVTAPELSPLFGQTLAGQVAEVLRASSSTAVLEFGAGSGLLAAQLLDALDAPDSPGSSHRRGQVCDSYSIIELSATLRQTQRETLQRHAPKHAHKVRWLDALPESFSGCIIGNEVLDAMPVRLIERGSTGAGSASGSGSGSGSVEAISRHAVDPARGVGEAGLKAAWLERGVVWHDGALAFATMPADDALRSLIEARITDASDLAEGYATEIAEEAPGFVATLAGVLTRGAAIFIDYGFPGRECYHPQRSGGTLMCHRAHQSHTDPLLHVGQQDITAHVDFSAVALAGQDAGFEVAGYTSQGRFLINAGLPALLAEADRSVRTAAQMLMAEHEMGELFKVIAFTRGLQPDAAPLLGFASGDRTHTL